ncbi:YHS domain-containing (seleno)protein [Salinibius halmophilus]|uniref:YHS domain-containing (seleno)protein n=1 Tax=Salinibius halmophilus TaxID=1853216 RepID=UPI000E66160E|nr:YHS domain-containing (seleno)protein [Salinibius halmophilus]
MKKLFLSVLLVALASVSLADKPPVYSSWGNAIRGYDPVAFFTESKAVEGDKAIQYEWQDTTWLFSSVENKALFVENPEQYAPQYGGYCAWAVSQGYTASVDPTAWTIVDDKLYLNYSRSVHSRWKQNVSQNIKLGDANWPNVLD